MHKFLLTLSGVLGWTVVGQYESTREFAHSEGHLYTISFDVLGRGNATHQISILKERVLLGSSVFERLLYHYHRCA